MNIIDRVKAVFLSAEPVTENVTVKLEAFETADGKTIEVEALESGQAVMIDGQAATEGDIVLADGRTIKIDAEGKIAEVVDAPAEDEAELSAIADLEATVLILAEKINAIEAGKANNEAEMSALKTANDKLNKENEALKVKPAAAPAKFSKIEVAETPEIKGDFTAILKRAANKTAKK